jgi:hypothetical protein
VVDYAKLADKAKALQEAANSEDRREDRHDEALEHDPAAFYHAVKSYLIKEINKANPELIKRGVHALERSFLPSYSGKFCFTFGISLLCSVELDALAGRSCIRAAISGPPNGKEVGRREYYFNRGGLEPAAYRAEAGGITTVVGLSPEEIAIDIVSSLLSGEFS